MSRLTRDQMAARVARDIPEGAYVNLGIGLPTSVANYLPADKDIFLQSAKGLLGMGQAQAPGEEDQDPINAGHQPGDLLRGPTHPQHDPPFRLTTEQHTEPFGPRA